MKVAVTLQQLRVPYLPGYSQSTTSPIHLGRCRVSMSWKIEDSEFSEVNKVELQELNRSRLIDNGPKVCNDKVTHMFQFW